MGATDPAGAPADVDGAASQGQTPSIEWIREFTRHWYDAWNSHDVDRVLELMTDDIEYRDDGWPTVMRGHSDVRRFLRSLWTAFPDTNFEIVAGPYVVPGEPRAATHWLGTGTHTGTFHPPGVGPTDRRWEFDGADFQEYRDGLVCKLRITCDTLTGFRQLGLLPHAGTRTERTVAWLHRGAMRARRARNRWA